MTQSEIVIPYTRDGTELVAIDTDIQHPWERVALANQLAVRSSLDPEIRRIAGIVLKDCLNIPKDGAKRVAKWVRQNFLYLQESPGIEVLQGPKTSMYTNVVDCDDAAILFVALTRAAGLNTYFCGVGLDTDEGDFLHAIGYDATTGKLFELIDDRHYLPDRWVWRNSINFRLFPGLFAVYFSDDPENRGFYMSRGGSFEAVELTTETQNNGAIHERIRLMNSPESEDMTMTCRGCMPAAGMRGSFNMQGWSTSTDPSKADVAPSAGGGSVTGDATPSGGESTWYGSVLDFLQPVAVAAVAPDQTTVVYEQQQVAAEPEDNKMWWIVGGIAAGGLLYYIATR